MTNPELGGWIRSQIALLRGKTEFPEIEVYALAVHVLQKSKAWIVSHPEIQIDEAQLIRLESSLKRLIAGEPLAYVIGKQSFFGLDLRVDPRVLIPRPETELLVELAISWLEIHPGRVKVADIGTGSGAIAIALAVHNSHLSITATDISADALKVARSNAILHHVSERIEFIQADLLIGVKDEFDLVLANLPYITTQTLADLSQLRYEPQSALDGGEDGLAIIRELLHNCEKKIAISGCVFLEIQYNEFEAVKELVLLQFPRAKVSLYFDLASLPRVVQIQL